MLAAKQTTAGGDPNGYLTGYTYNLSGALIEETYPSGRKVKNVLDNDGELSLVQSPAVDNGYDLCPRRGREIIAQGKAVSAATLGTRRKIDRWSSVRSDRILSAASRLRVSIFHPDATP